MRLTLQEGNIASQVTDDTGCGRQGAAWLIEVAEGQKVNISLYNFGTEESTFRHRGCLKLGEISETNPSKNTTICAGKDRVSHLVLSSGNRMTITIEPKEKRQNFNFLLKYKSKWASTSRPPRRQSVTCATQLSGTYDTLASRD